MKIRHLVSALLLGLLVSGTVTAQGTRLLRHPTVSRDLVAFEYAGDLWVVSRSGGQARRLTATPGVEIDPSFSPDGTHIAFTATVAGNTDVYVVPTTGGEPKRLTYHPGSDRVRGWSPDGRRVVFASLRTSAPQEAYFRLWTIGFEGGFPEPLPLPRAFTGSYSPDGRRLAYEEISTHFIPQWYEASLWRHYRGGRTHPISVVNLADYTVEKLPWTNSNDTQFKRVASMIRNAVLSPSGIRAAFEARCEIFTVPAEKGDYRNLTQSPGAHDRTSSKNMHKSTVIPNFQIKSATEENVSINSNVVDVAQWLRLQLGEGALENQRLISSGAFKEMQTSQTMMRAEFPFSLWHPEIHFVNYGLGWILSDYRGRKVVEHLGAIDGMRAQVALIPEEKLGLVILANRGSSLPAALTYKNFDAYLAAPPRDWSAEMLKSEKASAGQD